MRPRPTDHPTPAAAPLPECPEPPDEQVATPAPPPGTGTPGDRPRLVIVRYGGQVDRRSERGQATAEYGLVLLGAAAVALLLVAWATETGAVGRLLDAVLDSILQRV